MIEQYGARILTRHREMEMDMEREEEGMKQTKQILYIHSIRPSSVRHVSRGRD